jgi:hypothetical protein
MTQQTSRSTVWQQANPAKCARCSVRLSGYSPGLPPICTGCVKLAGASARSTWKEFVEATYPLTADDTANINPDGSRGRQWATSLTYDFTETPQDAAAIGAEIESVLARYEAANPGVEVLQELREAYEAWR